MIARVEQLEQLVNQLAARLASAEARTGALEQSRWQTVGGPTTGPSGGGGVGVLVVTTACSGATAGSATTDGRGTVQFWGGSGYTAGDTGIVITNLNEKGIKVGAYVLVGADGLGNVWVLVPDLCANLV